MPETWLDFPPENATIEKDLTGLLRGKLNEIVHASAAIDRRADDVSLFEGEGDLTAVLSKTIWDPDAQCVQQ